MRNAEEEAQYLFSLWRTMLSGIGLKSEVKDERAKESALVTVSIITRECDNIVQSNDCAPYYSKEYWVEVKKKLNEF